MSPHAAWRHAAWPLLVLVSACSAPEPRPPVVEAVPAAPEPSQAPVEEVVAKPEPAPTPARAPDLRALMKRSLKPIPTRPLNVRAKCNFRDETGYRGRLDLLVKDAEVRQFAAEVTIPKRGACSFKLKDFAQAERLPNVRLEQAGGPCTVRMWEQGARTTVAFNNCAAQCSGEAFDYLWPILVETKRGRCS